MNRDGATKQRQKGTILPDSRIEVAEVLSVVPLQNATEIDPRFATAYAWLGRAYGGTGEAGLSAEATRKALAITGSRE